MDFFIGLVLGYIAGKPDAPMVAEPASLEMKAFVGGFMLIFLALIVVAMMRALKRSL